MKKSSKPKMPKITQGLKDAVVTYLAATAYLETIRPRVEAYQAEVIAAANLQYSDEFAPDYTGTIATMKDSWMMDDRQADAFYAALDAARDAAGFTGFNPGCCPVLVAEHDVIKARWLICDEAAYITNVTKEQVTSRIEIFHQYTEAAVSLVLALCPDINTKTVMASLAK